MNPYDVDIKCYVCCISDDIMEYPVVTWIKGTPVCQEHVTWIVNADLLGIDEDEEEE